MTRYTRLRFYARLLLDRELRVRNYTSKIVKSFLAECSERLRTILNAREKNIAKPLSVSPLFRHREFSKIEAVYPGGPNPSAIREPTLSNGEVVFFDVSLGGELNDEVQRLIECFSDGVNVVFEGYTVTLEPLKVEEVVSWDSDENPLVDLARVKSLKVIFASPTLPVNPWSRSRWKRLIPAPAYLFAVNAHELFDPDDSLVMRALISAEQVLSPSYTALETARVRWYRYDGDVLPGLVGYVKFHIDLDGVGEEGVRLASMLVSHAAVMGAGSSRASGFGTLIIEYV